MRFRGNGVARRRRSECLGGDSGWLIGGLGGTSRFLRRNLVLGATVNLPLVATENCTLCSRSVVVRRSKLLASPTTMERRTDAWMGDEDVAEALLGAGGHEGGAVEAPRGESSDDPLVDRVGAVGAGSVVRGSGLLATCAGGAQAGPVQGVDRGAARRVSPGCRRSACSTRCALLATRAGTAG